MMTLVAAALIRIVWVAILAVAWSLRDERELARREAIENPPIPPMWIVR